MNVLRKGKPKNQRHLNHWTHHQPHVSNTKKENTFHECHRQERANELTTFKPQEPPTSYPKHTDG